MPSSLQHLKINGHVLKERDSVLMNIIAAAMLHSMVFVTVCCYRRLLALQMANMITEIRNISGVETVSFHAQYINSCKQFVS